MEEVWENIENYEGLYQISNFGRVKSLSKIVKRPIGTFNKKEKILTNSFRHGYPVISLRKHTRDQISYYIHRLVASAFIQNPENKPQVNHINGDRSNSTLANLEWVTCSDNIAHAYRVLNRVKHRTGNTDARQSITVARPGSMILEEYDSMDIAAKNLNVGGAFVSMCCSGKSRFRNGTLIFKT